MDERRIPQRQLAADLGMAQQTLSDRLRGRTAFDAEQVLTIAELLSVPVSALMEEPGAREHTDVAPHPRAPIAQPIPA